jgi:hypothetical protein
MKPAYSIFLFLALAICSCGAGGGFANADNAFDAGREFIDGCLKGDFSKATFYMINDEENNRDLQEIKRDYKAKSTEQKQEYYTASIIVQEEETLSDSVHIIYYMNSYDKIARKVKVILRNGNWQVDFKYTFNGNL